MATTQTFHTLDPNARKKLVIQDYDPYVQVFCDSVNKKLHACLLDPETGYRGGTGTNFGETLFFHIVYKKVAIWVRAERPSLDDEFIINFFATKKPIGTYSSEVPTIVRSKDAIYHDGCKHYAINCPNQPVASALEFLFHNKMSRERLISNWLFYDKLGWQGTLGAPEKISPASIYCRGYP